MLFLLPIAKHRVMLWMHSVIVRQVLVNAVSILLHCFFNILNYVELALSNIPKNKICPDKPHQWNQPINSVDNGPILFPEILFVHDSYGKHKADGTAVRLDKHKNYCACISIPLEESIQQFCMNLEVKNVLLFTAVLWGNDCKLVYRVSNSSSSVVVTSDRPLSSTTTAIPVTPEQDVWSRFNVMPVQAADIEIKTRGQSDSLVWYEECR